MKEKRALWILAMVVVLVVAIVAGCGSDTTTTTAPAASTTVSEATTTSAAPSETTTTVAATQKLKVSVLSAHYGSAAPKECIDLFKQMGDAMGWDVQIHDTNGDMNALQGLYETAAVQKPDVIINGFMDVSLIQNGLKTAQAAGIPVYGLDGNADPLEVANITSDNTDIGTQMAKHLAAAIGNKGNVVIMKYDQHPGVLARITAALKELATYPDIKIIETHAVMYPGAIEDGQTTMANLLTAHPGKGEIAGVLCGFDEPAVGCDQAIAAAGRSAEIKVVSTDAIPAALAEILKPGSSHLGTMRQDWKAVSQKTIDLILQAVAGNPLPMGSNVEVPALWVDASNAAQFVTQ